MSPGLVFVAIGFLAVGADPPAEPKEVASWKGSGKVVTALRFSPDSKTLACAELGDESKFMLREARTGRKLSTPEGPLGAISTIIFTADGKLIAATEGEGKVRVWEVATGKKKAEFDSQLERMILALAFSGDGRTLFAAGEQLVESKGLAGGGSKTLESQFGRRVSAHGGAAFSADGKTLASTNYQDLDLWDVGSGKIRRIFADHRGSVFAPALSADGKSVAVGVQRNEGYNKESWEVKVYHGETGKELATIDGNAGTLSRIALDDKAQTLLVQYRPFVGKWYSRDERDEVRLYDLATGRERCARKAVKGWCHLSPDGKLLATVEGDNQIKVWEVPQTATTKDR
jgi:WD40 repeat protein